MQSLPEPQAQILCGFRQCWLPSLCFFICPEELGAAVGNEESTPQACAPQACAPLACTMCSPYHQGISCPTPTPNFTGLRHPYPRHRRGLTLHRTNPREGASLCCLESSLWHCGGWSLHMVPPATSFRKRVFTDGIESQSQTVLVWSGHQP